MVYISNFCDYNGSKLRFVFAYGAKLGNSNESNESFKVTVGGLSYALTEHVVGKSSEYTGRFVANSDFEVISR
ncbi:MAG: hypothetical protein ACJASL_004176 [Paraglaciecola sp.]|jgi:hypothetical protein